MGEALDDIQKSILRLRAELRDNPPFYANVMARTPAVTPAIAIISGIIFQYYFRVNSWLLLGLCIGVSAAFLIFSRLSGSQSVKVKMVLAIFCFIFLGSARLSVFEKPAANDIRIFTAATPRFVHIRAELTTEPLVVTANDWKMARFSRAEPYIVFYAKLSQLKTVDGWVNVSGKIKFYASRQDKLLQVGDKIQSFCKIKTFSPAGNPGQFDYKKLMNHKGIYVSASVKNTASIEILPNSGNNIAVRFQSKLRQFAQLFLNYGIESEDAGGILDALLLGVRTKISPETYLAFKSTGLLHLISLSGLHVGILAGIIWWIGKKFAMVRSRRAAICALAIVVFVIIVPARTPTIRASIMFLTFCAAEIFKKRASAFNSLALAAIIITMIKPMDIFSVGFALSFAAVIAILFFYKPLSHRMADYIAKIVPALLRKPLATIMNMVIISFCAWLGIAGIVAFYFYKIQPAGIICTAVVMPFIVVILPLGFIKILLAAVLPSLSHFLALPLEFVTSLFVSVVQSLASLVPEPIITGRINILIVLLYYAILTCWAIPVAKHIRLKTVLCLAGTTAVILLLWQFNFTGGANGVLNLNVLSVGHGQCIVATLPGGETIIFDCGSLNKNNVGRRIANSFLDYTGRRKIDSVYLSHNHTDHINGVPEIIEQREVEKVYVPARFITQANSLNTVATIVALLKENEIAIQPTAKSTSYGSVTVKKLWPVNDASIQGLSENDSSTVLVITYAGKRILLCADIGEYTQNKLIQLYPKLDIDVLIKPHHGSRENALEVFESAFSPEYTIASCSRYQFAGGDIDKTLATSESGCINIKISGVGELEVSSFR